MLGFVKDFFSGKTQNRLIRSLQETYVEPVNALEDKCSRLSDTELRTKTTEFRDRLENGASL
ncbi:MAG TPA: hypothetical protein VLH40_06180, partial [Atribacteraceae bacterium]|nr:hypothetical protein [Atribacteraceae bacterium]